jgi:hypothetical protein
VLAGAGGLDRRIERQQVRLLGDRLDDANDPCDVLALLSELVDLADDTPTDARSRSTNSSDLACASTKRESMKVCT